jgi:hypothetical protein
MPLSEHERRILNSLEESLESDIRFAGRVGGRSNTTARRRQTRIVSVVGFLVGVAVLVLLYTRSVALGIVGVTMMMGSALYFTTTLSSGDGLSR